MTEAELDDGDVPGAGRARRDANASVGDIFNRADTKTELTFGTVLFALVGVGLGLGVLLADAFEEGAFVDTLFTGVILAPLLAIVVAQRVATELADLPDNLALGTAAVTTLAGTVVLGLVLWLFTTIVTDFAPDLGDVLLPVIGVAIGAAATAAGAVWALRTLVD